MNEIKRTDVNTLGEFGLIDHLTKDIFPIHTATRRGIGDDAAVINGADDNVIVITTDMLVEGIHFDLIYSPLKHLGYKSMVVNFSDIYAMNAFPRQVLISIAFSSKYSVEALEEFYAGVQLACRLYGVDLIGGDTTSSPRGMTISVTAIGEGHQDRIVYRDGAKAGDIICVTGNLGAAYLGLQVLEREKQIFLDHPDIQPELDKHHYLVERQLKPEARKDAVEYFHEKGFKPTAMIDISDGLASEIFHICKQSGTGAYIEEAKVPIHPDAEELALEFKINPITCALNGGEDYELLFTIDPSDLELVKTMPDIFLIGDILEPGEGITLHTTGGKIVPLEAQGWKHF
jgi:thiamine-monophosphate kinase